MDTPRTLPALFTDLEGAIAQGHLRRAAATLAEIHTRLLAQGYVLTSEPVLLDPTDRWRVALAQAEAHLVARWPVLAEGPQAPPMTRLHHYLRAPD